MLSCYRPTVSDRYFRYVSALGIKDTLTNQNKDRSVAPEFPQLGKNQLGNARVDVEVSGRGFEMNPG